ncbi:MAG TPA: hypothetical protein PLL77_08685 [Pyrinomonadaceae bacterium]|nr:hypothetical protein [Pyrinomonadaceae bacterium]
MNQPLNGRTSIIAISMMLLLSASFLAQTTTQVEPSYNVSLQLVIGSNDAQTRGDLPAELNNVSRQLKSSFAFTNYRLASTFLGRISNTGNFEYKSTSNIFGQESSGVTQSFIEWSAINFRSMPNAAGQTGFQTQSFRFGARVPVLIAERKDEVGKVQPVYNYEQIGLNISKVGLSQNTPTLIGTLNLPGTSGTIFLVMTVRSAD